MSNKLSVYISSTFADLQDFREAVRLALRRIGFDIIALEDFGASESPPLDACLSALASSDYVLLILANRYGYIPPGEDKSIIEIEYREARNLGKPILIFMLDDDTPWPRKFIETGRGGEALMLFKHELLSNHTVSYFQSPE